jgi:tRNA modification GTPase
MTVPVLTDTIVARATPAGRGGVAVIRLSGPRAGQIASEILDDVPSPRRAALRAFRDAEGQAIDVGIALWFPAPASYTGEDVLELHGHGGPMVCEMLLERAVELGARMARPGEFTERAYLNDKIDLLQAEAIADLIDSGSRAAARAARRSLQGTFSAAVRGLDEQLAEVRTYVEAALDFPDEEVDFLADTQLDERLDGIAARFVALEQTVRQGCLLRDGALVVLAGRPNAGKSSLLNALAGRDLAIVTPLPGTTRDLVTAQLDLDGLPLQVIDTAGLREVQDPVELEGVRRARDQLGTADLALLVIDASSGAGDEAALLAEVPAGIPVIRVRNKVDLTGECAGPHAADRFAVNVSSLRGAGLPALRDLIKDAIGYAGTGEGTVTARQRHMDAVRRARRHFDAGRGQLTGNRAGELLAEELRAAQNALAEITGEFTSDDLLGRIFASFCIGK